jgi:Ser/Thr protein kinase RdoA (MazF antagonist)
VARPVVDPHPYDALTPDVVLGAADAVGFATDGRLLALNSYENRVYQLGLDGGGFVVAKFYRPGRWSDAAIGEEHAFAAELVAAELPVVAPIARDGTTLFVHAGFRFALFPRRGGRAPELEGADAAAWMGRTLGRVHAVGARAGFVYRERIGVDAMVRGAARQVLAGALLPPVLAARYRAAADAAARALDDAWRAVGPVATLRLHGDCHAGNVLWTDAGPLLVDLDDARSGPAVQDLWMLFSGSEAQRAALIEGYEQFRPFDLRELTLAEPLRLMRQIHYAGWLSSRWSDPAFPFAFPWAAEPRWWETHADDIREGTERLQSDGSG